MERLLTPLVHRYLRKFVKSSQEGVNETFKASLSGGGGIALHNLELDVQPLLPVGGTIFAQRAFARALHINIPWTALNTQPIEVILESVEVILSPGVPDVAPSTLSNDNLTPATGLGNPEEEDTSSTTVENDCEANNNASSMAGGWLGSWFNLQSLVLRACLNTSFTIKNLLVKVVRPGECTLMVALERLVLSSPDVEEWGHAVDNPQAWLRKDCVFKGLSLTLDDDFASGATAGSQRKLPSGGLPVLRLSNVRISALAPAFAYLEDEELGEDAFKVSLDIDLGPAASGALNDLQLVCIGAILGGFRGSKNDEDGENSKIQRVDGELRHRVDDGGKKESVEAGGIERKGVTAGNETQVGTAPQSVNVARAAVAADVSSSPMQGSTSHILGPAAANVDEESSESDQQEDHEMEDDLRPQHTVYIEMLLTCGGFTYELGVVDLHPPALACIHPFVRCELAGIQTHVACIGTQAHHVTVRAERVAFRHNRAAAEVASRQLLSTTRPNAPVVLSRHAEDGDGKSKIDKTTVDSSDAAAAPPRPNATPSADGIVWEDFLRIETVSGTERTGEDIAQSAVEVSWSSEAVAQGTETTMPEEGNGRDHRHHREVNSPRCRLHAGAVELADEPSVRDCLSAFVGRYGSILALRENPEAEGKEERERSITDRGRVLPKSESTTASETTHPGWSTAAADTVTVTATSARGEHPEERDGPPWWYTWGGVHLEATTVRFKTKHQDVVSNTAKTAALVLAVGRHATSHPMSNTIVHAGVTEQHEQADSLQRDLEAARLALAAMQAERDALRSQLTRLKATVLLQSEREEQQTTGVDHHYPHQHHPHHHQQQQQNSEALLVAHDAVVAPNVTSAASASNARVVPIVLETEGATTLAESEGLASGRPNGMATADIDASVASVAGTDERNGVRDSKVVHKQHQRQKSWTESLASSWIFFLQSEADPEDSEEQ